jgi:hypothetical protein
MGATREQIAKDAAEAVEKYNFVENERKDYANLNLV